MLKNPAGTVLLVPDPQIEIVGDAQKVDPILGPEIIPETIDRTHRHPIDDPEEPKVNLVQYLETDIDNPQEDIDEVDPDPIHQQPNKAIQDTIGIKIMNTVVHHTGGVNKKILDLSGSHR